MNFQEKLQSRHQFVDWRKHGYIKKPSNLFTNLYFRSISFMYYYAYYTWIDYKTIGLKHNLNNMISADCQPHFEINSTIFVIKNNVLVSLNIGK